MPSNLKIARNMKNRVVVGTKVRKKTSAIKTVQVEEVRNKMANQDVLPRSAKTSGNPSMDVLFAIGCTVSPEGREFSLLSTETDEEVIRNPNIIDDSKWKELKNVKISAQDKFPYTSDNFYKADYPVSQKLKTEVVDKSKNKQVTKNTNKIATDILKINFQADYKKTLTQFK